MSFSGLHAQADIGTVESAAVTRFDQIAAGFVTLSSKRQAMLGILLSATVPQVPHDISSLRPLWADEAMQRAYDLVAMFGMLDCTGVSQIGPDGEWQLVHHLARTYASLQISGIGNARTCSTDLRDMVRDLTELFAPVAHSITLSTAIDHLSLPPLERRALILAASKLVLDAIRRASKSGGAARLTVALTVVWPCMASLRVMLETHGRTDIRHPSCDNMVDDLAILLNCKPDVFETAFGIHTELRFSLDVANRG